VQATAQSARGVSLEHGLEAERGHGVAQRVFGRGGIGRGELASDLASRELDPAELGRGRGDRAGEPAGKVTVRAGCGPAGRGLRRYRPLGAWAPPGPPGPAPDHQARLDQAVEMDAHSVRVQAETLGELVSWRRSTQIAQEPEEPSARGLGERIADVGLGEIHERQFLTGGVGEP